MHSSIVLLAVVSALATFLPVVVDAHFTLSGPAPSREKQAYPTDNTRFFPIGAPDNMRPEKDCLQYPRGQVASLSAGQQVTFPFEIGNGASHIGMCTASLINLDNNQETSLGQVDNCVSRDKAITLTMPTSSCPNCVVKVKVTAVHLGPQNPEFYDSCVDVKISGGNGNAIVDAPVVDAPVADDETPVAEVPAEEVPVVAAPAPEAPIAEEPVAEEPVAETPAPSTGDNGQSRRGRRRNGRNGRGRRNQATTPTTSSSSSQCTSGDFVCGTDGTTIRHCSQGAFIDFAVPPGTSCDGSSGTPTIVRKF